MKKLFVIALSFSFFYNCFSQDYENEVLERERNWDFFEGFSLGFLVQGQTKYPSPYYGPDVKGLYNDGAFHLILDLYIKKFLVGFQITDEYLYFKKIDDKGALWKPRGFNNSYSSLTRAYWLSLGYNFFKGLNFKLSLGFRKGPANSFIIDQDKDPSEIAEGFGYFNSDNGINQERTSNSDFSETDFSLSINHPIRVYKRFGIVPEIGYSINYGGIISGLSIIFFNLPYEVEKEE